MSALLGCAVAGGALVGCAVSLGDAPATPEAAESVEPSPEAHEGVTPTVIPSAAATSEATATAPPTPIPVGVVGEIDLEATSCPGGVVLQWSALTDPRFHHYLVLRSPSPEIAPDYPPIAPAVDWGQTFATDPFVRTAVDASIVPGPTEWSYRAIAYDARDRPLAASPVRQARLDPVVALGDLRATRGPDGAARLRWSGYDGNGDCFSWYVLLASRSDPVPSLGDGSATVAVISSQATTELLTDALEHGATYFLRIQAIRATPLGEFVVAESEVTTYTMP